MYTMKHRPPAELAVKIKQNMKPPIIVHNTLSMIIDHFDGIDPDRIKQSVGQYGTHIETTYIGGGEDAQKLIVGCGCVGAHIAHLATGKNTIYLEGRKVLRELLGISRWELDELLNYCGTSPHIPGKDGLSKHADRFGAFGVIPWWKEPYEVFCNLREVIFPDGYQE